MKYTVQEYAEAASKANQANKTLLINSEGDLELIDCDNNKYVPQALSRFQAITILKLTKVSKDKSLYQAADDYINSLSDDSVENITAKTAWQTAQEFRRDSALIKMAQSLFKLTDEQVDEMFKQGAKITA